MGIVQKSGLRITIISYIGAAIGYLNKIILFPRFFDVEEVGLINLLVYLATLYAQLSNLGIVSITLKFFPFFRNEKKSHEGFLPWALLFTLVGFLIITLFFFFIDDFLISYYSGNSPLVVEYLYYLIPLGLVVTFSNFFDGYLRSLYKTVFSSFSYEIILRLLITVSITLFAINIVDFKTFVAIYIIVYSTPTIILLIYTIIIKQLFFKIYISRTLNRLAKIIIVYGLFSALNTVGYLLLNVIDSIMLAGMIDLKATGIYTTIALLTTILLLPYRAIGKISAPIIADYWKNKDMKKMEEIYTNVSTIGLLVGSFLFTLLWVNLDYIFMLIPSVYSAGKVVFLVFGITKIVEMYTGLNGYIIITSKKYKFDNVFTIILVFITVFLNYLFIPKWGMNGAAVATLLTTILFNFMRTLFVFKSFRIHPFRLKHILLFIIGVISVIPSFFVNSFENLFIDIIIQSSIVCILFVIPVYLFKISVEANEFINKIINRIFIFLTSK